MSRYNFSFDKFDKILNPSYLRIEHNLKKFVYFIKVRWVSPEVPGDRQDLECNL